MKCKKSFADIWLTIDKAEDRTRMVLYYASGLMDISATDFRRSQLVQISQEVVDLVDKVKVIVERVTGFKIDSTAVIVESMNMTDLMDNLRKFETYSQAVKQIADFLGYKRESIDNYAKASLKQAFLDLLNLTITIQMQINLYIKEENEIMRGIKPVFKEMFESVKQIQAVIATMYPILQWAKVDRLNGMMNEILDNMFVLQDNSIRLFDSELKIPTIEPVNQMTYRGMEWIMNLTTVEAEKVQQYIERYGYRKKDPDACEKVMFKIEVEYLLKYVHELKCKFDVYMRMKVIE